MIDPLDLDPGEEPGGGTRSVADGYVKIAKHESRVGPRLKDALDDPGRKSARCRLYSRAYAMNYCNAWYREARCRLTR